MELGEWYLHDEPSGIGNYQTWWINDPNNAYPAILNHTLAVGYYFVKGFISNEIPFSINLSAPHNWMAKLYAVRENTSYGIIHVDLYGYRNGNEKLIFRMDPQPITVAGNPTGENRTAYIWQSQDYQDYRVQENDRIICKIYLNVTAGGWFAFAYDHVKYGSSVTDPVEYRYFRNQITEDKVYASSYTTIQGSLSSGSLSNLTSSDNVYMVFNSETVGSYDWIEVLFNGTVTGSQPLLELEVEGKYSVVINSQFNSLYNYDLDRYAQSGEDGYDIFEFATTDRIRYLTETYNFSRFRDLASGEWSYNITIYAENPFSVSLDYLHFRLWAYELGTSQTTSYKTSGDLKNQVVGIRVYPQYENGTEIEITDYLSANVTVPTSAPWWKLGSWWCPERENVSRVIVRIEATGAGLLWSFITEELNATLDWYQWHLWYYFAAVNVGTPWFPNWQYYLRFGSATYDTRIGGFKWHVPSAKEWYGIAAWSFTLITRQWTSIVSWTLTLLTRQWVSIASWSLTLITKGWAIIASWSFTLFARGWWIVASWTLGLVLRRAFPFILIIMALFILFLFSYGTKEETR